MNRDSVDARPRYFWPLIAFFVGILAGLLIGWVIWPVKWTNTYPQDLIAAERDEYLAMVAESYAANRDLSLARQRLRGWSAEDQAELLTYLQEAAIGTDAKRAADVQMLLSALSLGGQAAPGVSPTASVAGRPTQPSGGLSLLRTVCTAAVWILLAAGAVVLFVYLFQRWRRSQQAVAGRSIRDLQRSPERGREPAARRPADYFEDLKSQWPAPRDDFDESSSPAMESPPPAWPSEVETRDAERPGADAFSLPARPEEPPPVSSRYSPADEMRPEPQAEPPKRTPPAPAFRRTSPPTRLGDFSAVYQGEADYDEAFDINDPIDGYMGQCGLQLNDPVGRARDQAVALQVWLWDSSDPDTRVKVLMSEGAYRDTGLRSEQAGEHEVISIRAGTDFTLETHDLLLRGAVEQVEYAEQEPYRGVFAEVRIKLQAFRKS